MKNKLVKQCDECSDGESSLWTIVMVACCDGGLLCWFSALHYAASLSGPTDVLEMLLSFGADVDVLNNEASTPLFFATQSNNQFAACVLINQGANVRQKNGHGGYQCLHSVAVLFGLIWE